MNKEKMIGAVLALVAVLGIGVFALTSGDDDTASTNTSVNSVESTEEASKLPFDFAVNNLSPLESGVYEGWIVRDDVKYSFGTFNTNEAGEIVGDLMLDDITPQDGDKVVVTIEPTNDADPDPSGTVVLAGDLVGGSADLTFPVDITAFSGKYILATPSDGDGNNETSGLWFVSQENGPAETGLNLPIAPEGWIYEGWAVYNGAPLSTGQFTDPAAADNLDAYNGDQGTPNWPGEDFLVNLPSDVEAPVNLANGTSKAVISLEPFIDGEDPTGEGPAQVKPLAHDIPEGVADHDTQDLTLDTSSLPTGSASL